ncbi:hypothetical protein [Thiothrix nivea]|uniref:Transcription elongation factor n=1 Tax=Thiothrix nivea (strain ATCC 35100 / DSM 5205 / JP2) TaxID=870187 RepID=A0A656HG89_THINJ|nr:hypothetical protein [Thiothrix nivea]EIJ35457.1 hypothetical protein Thini_2931 [Thiothrix nivea DSM 5205]
MINKIALRETMLSLELDKLHTVEANYQEFLQQARVDNTDGYDDDELSHALESSDMAALLDQSIHEYQEKIDRLKAIDFSPRTQVEPGAVVKFKNRHFVISVATNQFECTGESYMGISADAPVYAALQGLEAGDTFDLNGKEVKIQAVY